MSYEKLLSQLDFSPKEIQVYLGLLELGETTANAIGRSVGIARTTTYSVLEGLKRRGLVTPEKRRGVTYFIANHPQALLRAVEREQRRIGEQIRVTQELVEVILPLFRSKNFNIPRLHFYEGEKNVEGMLFSNLNDWEQSMLVDDKTLWGYQDHSFVKPYTRWLKHHWEQNHKKKLKVKLFSNRSEEEEILRGKVKERTIRLFPPEFQFDSSLWVMGDYVVVLITQHKPHFAFQLKDARFATSLKMIFRLLWRLKL